MKTFILFCSVICLPLLGEGAVVGGIGGAINITSVTFPDGTVQVSSPTAGASGITPVGITFSVADTTATVGGSYTLNPSSNLVRLWLPLASAVPGQVFAVADISGNNFADIYFAGSDVMKGVNNATAASGKLRMGASSNGCSFYSDGTNWHIIVNNTCY